MSRKQKGRNGFYYFMLEWRQREEQRGRKFDSLREVQADPRCSDEWKSLTPQEKQVYTTMAKKCKETYLDKQTTVGESMSLVQQQQQEEEEFLEKMLSYVTTTIANGLENKTLCDTKFHFIHFNWFYIVEGKRYAPAEYAIGEFTFRDGIKNYRHTLVRLQPELGYTLEALETSNSSHKIPCPLPEGERDFYNMYLNLVQFLEGAKVDGKYPPLFTEKKLYEGVVSLLDQLAASANCENNFVVYEIELLFAKLRRVAFEEYSATANDNKFVDGLIDAMGQMEFLKDKFAFVPNIDCNFHKNIDGTCRYCSLAIIRQWAFTICDYCCEPLGIKMKPGVHCPENEITNDLVSSVMNITLNTTRYFNTTTFTGVSENHRLNVSQRTSKEEKERRTNNTPLSVIDYSQKTKQKTSSTTYERPLRPPNTKSFALAASANKQDENLQSYDANFPSFSVKSASSRSGSGRGVMLKGIPTTVKQPKGKGNGAK